MRINSLIISNPGQSSLKLQILFFPILGLTCVFKTQKIIPFSLMNMYTYEKNRAGRTSGEEGTICFTIIIILNLFFLSTLASLESGRVAQVY